MAQEFVLTKKTDAGSVYEKPNGHTRIELQDRTIVVFPSLPAWCVSVENGRTDDGWIRYDFAETNDRGLAMMIAYEFARTPLGNFDNIVTMDSTL